MAFDGIITYAVVKELQKKITLGKIEKIYQPEKDELIFHIHTKAGKVRLYASVSGTHPRIHITEDSPENPPIPMSFCMLLRKHVQNSRIVSVHQKDSERIVEISLETLNELGFTVSKKLIFEIMGKHSNIILIDVNTGKIIDSIKRVSIDVNRARQVLPGLEYRYPPVQEKTPFKNLTSDSILQCSGDPGALLAVIGGISPAIAREISASTHPAERLAEITSTVNSGAFVPRVYSDEKDKPVEFHITDLKEYEDSCRRIDFDTISPCLAYFFDHRQSSNRVNQKISDLAKSVTSALDKVMLKKQRLSEDILKAENSESLRLYGELLTANIHLVQPGAHTVKVQNYYDGNDVEIPLDNKYSVAKNAQQYFKRYGKSKTAIKEKNLQLKEVKADIEYLQSVLSYLENAETIDGIEAIRTELTETGYLRRRTNNIREKKYKAQPHKYTTSGGLEVLVGRNNKENDLLTLKTADKSDIWFHTKDIPGSHVILRTRGGQAEENDIFETAAIAAYHSKGRSSENVPVDYVKVKYVKKPSGAKPGMVIFTNNKTVWIDPALPD